MLCKKCGANISDGDVFCGECGSAVSAIKSETTSTICEKCGNRLQGGEVFCGECGTPTKKTRTVMTKVVSRKCPHCGTICANESEFCGECGRKLDVDISDKIKSSYESKPVIDADIIEKIDLPHDGMISSVPSYDSVGGGIKSTMKTVDKPIEPKETEQKTYGKRFFEKPGDLE